MPRLSPNPRSDELRFAGIVATFALLYAPLGSAAVKDSPSGERTTPSTIRVITPRGIPRGAVSEIKITGYNLAHASAVYFNQRGLAAKILRVRDLPDVDDVRLGGNGTPLSVDLGPLPAHNEVTVELDVAPDAPVGPVDFRILTPLGTSPTGRFLVEPFYGEAPDREPNDTQEQAFDTYLPAILVGTISKPGDVDFFKIKVADGERLVFEDGARMLGSSLQAIISIFDEQQNLIADFGRDGGRADSPFAYTFVKGGVYYLRVSDFQESGGANHTYRIKVGKLPVVLSAFPLGLPSGKSAEITLQGYNLADDKMQLKGTPTPEYPDRMELRPLGRSGAAFNKLMLALGSEPEILSVSSNNEPGKAQTIAVPSTVNGKLKAEQHYYRFHARKGQPLVVEVMASRLGSPLDSELDVLDLPGKPIERATVRSVLETSVTLADRDSRSTGLRFTSPAGFAVGDYVMVGSEITRVEVYPRGPDDDVQLTSFGGQRIAWLDTTPEAHAIDQPIYKVQIHSPGTKFASNGLPVVHLTFHNDDGGAGYGKDSLLHFSPPADGDYLLRIRDVRGQHSDDYAYRITIRQPKLDYRLSVTPRNPNLPAGGRIPITVTALRLDDFAGAIPVSVAHLPPGIHATPATIGAGQISTVIVLTADADAKLDHAVPLQVVSDQGRVANPDDPLRLLAMSPPADVQVTSTQHELSLRPGERAEVKVAVKRGNGFGGRVEIEVGNLPPGVRILDSGLNGILIAENETERSFSLEALPDAKPISQSIILSGLIETRSNQQNLFSAEPITLRVDPAAGQTASAQGGAAIGR